MIANIRRWFCKCNLLLGDNDTLNEWFWWYHIINNGADDNHIMNGADDILVCRNSYPSHLTEIFLWIIVTSLANNLRNSDGRDLSVWRAISLRRSGFYFIICRTATTQLLSQSNNFLCFTFVLFLFSFSCGENSTEVKEISHKFYKTLSPQRLLSGLSETENMNLFVRFSRVSN